MTAGRIALVAWLTAIWVGLWDDPTIGTAVAGLLVALGIVLFFPNPKAQPGPRLGFHPLRATRYLLVFAREFLIANAKVIWQTDRITTDIDEAVLVIPLHGDSDLLTAMVANVVTLTPGTLTVEVHRDPDWIAIHVLDLEDSERVRRDVQELELRTARAFFRKEYADRIEEAMRSEQGSAP